MQKAYEEEELGEGSGTSFIHVSLPIQIKWDGSDNYLATTDATGWGSDECLQFRDEAKVDRFFCGDDPAGEALWTHVEGKLQSWGDPTQCLYTDDSEFPKQKSCDTVDASDTWELPGTGGGYGILKSTSKSKCVIPAAGQGPRSIQLVDCTESDITKWKTTQPLLGENGKGLCSTQWSKDANGKPIFSDVPQRRSCFTTTGTALGQWNHEVVLQSDVASGFTTTLASRLLNHRIGEQPLANTADEETCSKECRAAAGCHSFNYNGVTKDCELTAETKATVAPMDFDQSSASADWTHYEPQTTTVNTKCTSGCLPSQTIRIDFPISGAKFGDDSTGLLPSAVASHFDSILFGGDADADAQAVCFSQVDAIVVEVKSFCQAAKTLLCAPDVTSPGTIEKCDVKKEAVCRRMVVMPTTFFGSAKAAYRDACGHGSAEDGKVWHSAKLSVDVCGAINGLNTYCADVENLV